MSTISTTFEKLRAENRAAFIPFFAAGDPDLSASAELIKQAAATGADIIEIGIPFSDPIADGPVIQASYYRALGNGFKIDGAFKMVRELRTGGVKTPLVCMVSYSLVYKRGLEKFFTDARAAGFDGMIVPDLPAGYEGDAVVQAEQAGIDLIFLVAPTTTAERRDAIVKRSRGFIYYISVAGITGARSALPEDLAANVADLKTRTQTPICVGFGISRPEQAAAVAKLADGVIVGSALVRMLEDGLNTGARGVALTRPVAELSGQLAAAAHSAR